MYDKIKDLSSEDEAYDWACNYMDADSREMFGITEPHKYKLCEVTFKLTMAVPDAYNDYEIEDASRDVLRYAECSVVTDEYDISEKELQNRSFDNDIEDLEW